MGTKKRGQKQDKAATTKGFSVRPFEELKSLKGQLLGESSPQPPPPRPHAVRRLPTSKADREAQAFTDAMADVVPLADRERVSKVKGGKRSSDARTMDEAAAIDAYLRDLVEGVLPFDIADTDEYIEGAVQGFDRRILRKLRRGEFAIQDHVDLHGLNRDEARSAVATFIKDAHGRGKRCVLIVHGRGLRSKDQIPVLKEKLKAWLTRGSIGTKVLAFASARPYDGGTGAVYVLLRR